MLTSLDIVKLIPGMSRQSDAVLTQFLGEADAGIKKWCQRNLEEDTYTEFYSGNNDPVLILREIPVSEVTSVHLDMTGYSGQGTNAFAASTLLTLGTDYFLELDKGGEVSNRGFLRKISGSAGGAWTLPLMSMGGYGGRLAGTRPAVWPLGYGNIKVVYTAGYAEIPEDLSGACASLVAWMVRNKPAGGVLSNESLGAYSYGTLQLASTGQLAELGSIVQTLKPYREIAM